MTNFHFDEATHTYTLDGKVLPSVTQILKQLTESVYRFVPQDVLDAAADLGRCVHKACELWNLGTLDEESLHPDIVPYLEGWKKFAAEAQFRPILVEAPLFHSALNYAGMIDAFGEQAGVPSLIDIKTTSVITAATVGPQTAAYADLIARAPAMEEFGKKKLRRSAVHLIGDGTYRQHFFSEDAERSVFLSCLSLHNWRKRHNI
jgi:hypothetical protein